MKQNRKRFTGGGNTFFHITFSGFSFSSFASFSLPAQSHEHGGNARRQQLL